MIFINNNVEANMEKKFYDLNIKSIEGNIIKFSEFKNKAVMLVNVASNCGFTKQYADLQKLWEKYQSQSN